MHGQIPPDSNSSRKPFTDPTHQMSPDAEYDSDISEDGDELLTPEDELNYEIRMKPCDTRKEQIISLFLNTDKVSPKTFFIRVI